MRTYIVLLSFTEEGVRQVGKSVKRHTAFKKIAEEHGIIIKETYWLNGPYDVLHIIETETEKDAMVHSLSLASTGNVRTQTFRAFSAEEITDILESTFNVFDLIRPVK